MSTIEYINYKEYTESKVNHFYVAKNNEKKIQYILISTYGSSFFFIVNYNILKIWIYLVNYEYSIDYQYFLLL